MMRASLLRALCLTAVIITSVLLSACTFRPSYEATVNSPDDGALVTGWMQSWPLFKVVLIGVDGHFRRGWDAWTTAPLLIDPGVRTLEVHGEYFDYFVVLPYKGEATVELKANLQPGHIYGLKIERDAGFLTFWLVDTTTQETVSERVTKEAHVAPILGGPGNNH